MRETSDRTRRLLVVADDVQTMIRGRRGELYHAGLNVTVTPSVIDALRSLWATEPPAAILTPPDLSEITFEDFASIVNVSRQAAVIAAVPAGTDETAIDTLTKQGAAAVVTTPASAITLAGIVRTVAPEPAVDEPPVFRCGELEMDVGGYRVRWHSREVTLLPSSFAVLRRLMEVCPRTVPNRELVDLLKPHTVSGGLNSLRAQIGRIRSQLNATLPNKPVPLETVVRVGYRINLLPELDSNQQPAG